MLRCVCFLSSVSPQQAATATAITKRSKHGESKNAGGESNNNALLEGKGSIIRSIVPRLVVNVFVCVCVLLLHANWNENQLRATRT